MVKHGLMFQGLWKPHWFTWQKGRNFKSLFRWALGRGRFVGWVSAMMVGSKLMRFPAAIFFQAKKKIMDSELRFALNGQPTKSRTQQWQGAKRVDAGFWGVYPIMAWNLTIGVNCFWCIHFESHWFIDSFQISPHLHHIPSTDACLSISSSQVNQFWA